MRSKSLPPLFAPLAALTLWTLGCGQATRQMDERAVAVPPSVAAAPAPDELDRVLHSAQRPSTPPHEVTLYYPRADDISTGCVATGKVHRRLPADADPLRFALLTLLDGPTEAERTAADVFSPFDQSPSSPSSTDLGDRFLDLQVADGLATVDFAGAGEMFFLQAACPSAMVTSSIEQTLRQFDQVRDVRFAIEGTPITQWEGDVGPRG